MRNWYREYFCITDDEKIRDKVMTIRVITTALTMILCLALMSITAYAFFSHDVSSAPATLKSATFDTDITIKSLADGSDVPVNVTAKSTYSALLSAGVEYEVTIQPEGDAKTGFCEISSAIFDTVYHTQQLGKDGDAYTSSITFVLKPSATVSVNFVPNWGTSVYYADYHLENENPDSYVLDGEVVELVVTVGQNEQSEPQDETTVTTTATTTTTTTATTTATKTTGTEATAGTQTTETSEKTTVTTESAQSTTQAQETTAVQTTTTVPAAP